MASTRNAAANELYLASLGGATEQIFTTRVLVCLDHKDLCSLSQCSRALLKAAFSTQLWSALLRKDFGSDEENISVQTFPQNFTPMSASTLNTGAKALYKQKFRDFQQKVQLKLNARIDYEATWSLNRRLNIVERCLDCTQVRLMIPLPFAALFSFCLLLTLYFDGANISVWACFAPLFYLFFYLMLCMIIARVVYKRQYSAGVLNGVWSNLRGPVRNFFSDVLGDNAWLAYFTTFIIFLAAAAVILVAVKLASLESGTSLASSSFATISWGLVFLPIWCLFCAFCVSPVIGFFKDLALFFISLALLWVPFFILAVCLAVKLDGEQYHKKTANIKMSLIFMPFWIMEGAVMLGTLSFLAIGIYRYRQGFLERIDDHAGVFLLVWSLVSPFVIFQALISARDDGHVRSVTHVDTVVPLLILIAWLLICALSFSLKYRTPFQNLQAERALASAGTMDLYQV